MTAPKNYDYIIIGAGASGCVVANRLSADPSISVLLLEAGIPDTPPEFRDALAVIKTWDAKYDWGYKSEPVPGLNNRTIGLIRGKVMGGSTSVHALMHVRGNRRDYDAWNFLGNEGWSFDELLPYFIKSENFDGGASEYRGSGGSLSVRRNPKPTAAALAFLDSAVKLGFKGPDWDYNGAVQENSAGRYQLVLTEDMKRDSASFAFLHPVLDRPNLTLFTGAEATRIIFEGNVACGVEFVRDGLTETALASREVIVSTGAYHTPKLLMLSGVGPVEELSAHGIGVVTDLPGVGQNLIDHVLLPLMYHSKKELPEPDFVAEAGLFVRTRAGMGAASPDLQINFNAGVHALAPSGIGHFFMFVIVLVQPQSRGYIRLRSANPLAPPLIQPNYMACNADVEVLRKGIDLCRQLTTTSPLAEFNDGAINLGLDKSDQEITAFIRNNSSTIWHPVGTCRMGHDRYAVVDPQLRVHGVKRLRIIDASIMPTIPAGNPAAACMMIGEKGADLILATKLST